MVALLLYCGVSVFDRYIYIYIWCTFIVLWDQSIFDRGLVHFCCTGRWSIFDRGIYVYIYIYIFGALLLYCGFRAFLQKYVYI
jgi:hypothetical protein